MLLQAMALSETFLPLLLLSLFYQMAISVSSGSDSIAINQSLSGGQKLISKGGNFALGFFTSDNSSRNFYMGIWYNKISEFTPVWMANRATPVSDPNRAVLQISQQDGNLVLLNQASFLIWSTNTTTTTTTTTASSTVAVLQDDGNLVLRDGDNSSNVFWKSLDNPTDTLLSSGKLALNKVTGVSQSLIAWKNSNNPAPGIFSFELDPSGATQYLAIWNNSKSYWSTGLWDGQIYTGIPEMTGVNPYLRYNMVYVNNDKEKYLAYYLNDNNNIVVRFVLDVSGQMKGWAWLEGSQQWTLFWSRPRAQCDVTAFCGPFGSCNEQTLSYCSCIMGFSQRSPQDWELNDHTGGCVRDTPLPCERRNSSNVEQDKFFQMSSVRLPDDAQVSQVSSVDECALACLSNCSCTAYSYGTNCSLWHGDLLNLQDQYGGLDGATVNIRLAASEIPSHSKKKRALIPWVVGGGVATFLVYSVVVLMFIVWQRKRNGLLTNASDQVVMGSLVVFRYSDLQRMTKNFSDKLGAGSFGSVFKGMLPDSTAIAVKKLHGIRQGEKQFRAEVSTLGTIQHVNLVALHGFCAEGTERLLVFDYMPNGSLDSHLFHSNAKVLDWSARYQIALGIARGLAYLHEKCRECIIHCDIKPENILLDAAFNPKVADFGLAKLLGREFSHVLTTMRGTIGYLAPEWISGLAITPKADVFSFGKMLLEIISGKRNAKQSESGVYYFPVKAAIKVREGMVDCLLDSRLQGNANMDELNIACRVACWCIQDVESERPTMGMVVQMLEGILEVGIPPVSSILRGLIVDSDTGNLVLSDILDDGVKQSIFTS